MSFLLATFFSYFFIGSIITSSDSLYLSILLLSVATLFFYLESVILLLISFYLLLAFQGFNRNSEFDTVVLLVAAICVLIVLVFSPLIQRFSLFIRERVATHKSRRKLKFITRKLGIEIRKVGREILKKMKSGKREDHTVRQLGLEIRQLGLEIRQLGFKMDRFRDEMHQFNRRMDILMAKKETSKAVFSSSKVVLEKRQNNIVSTVSTFIGIVASLGIALKEPINSSRPLFPSFSLFCIIFIIILSASSCFFINRATKLLLGIKFIFLDDFINESLDDFSNDVKSSIKYYTGKLIVSISVLGTCASGLLLGCMLQMRT